MSREICIENLPINVDAYKLSKIFKEGYIVSCRIDVDQKFSSLGKGYVVYDDPSSALSAVETMNGQSFYGAKIKVSLKPNIAADNIETVMENYTKIYIKNIPPFWEDSELLTEFCEFGEIVTAQVSMTDGKSNGYGFVLFKKHSSAIEAVMSKHPDLVVEPFIPKPIRNKSTVPSEKKENNLNKSTQKNNLHVKNIPEDMNDFALKELFEEFGKTTSVKVARDRNTGKSLKYGFVCFENEMNAEEARSVMNGKHLDLKPLIVSYFQKKEVRQQMNLESAIGEEKELKTKSKVLFSFSSN